MKISILCHLLKKFAEENQIFSDYNSILKHLSTLQHFTQRLKFCKEHFQRLGSGSARIVFVIPSTDLALKLAKNSKGIAQNHIEADGFLRNQILANAAVDSDPNDFWILTHLAKKINKARFQSLTGMTFDNFCEALKFWYEEHTGRTHKVIYDYPNKPKIVGRPDNYDDLLENEVFGETIDLAGNMGLQVGDLCRLSSWGEVGGKIKIIDLGLSTEVWQEFYS